MKDSMKGCGVFVGFCHMVVKTGKKRPGKNRYLPGGKNLFLYKLKQADQTSASS